MMARCAPGPPGVYPRLPRRPPKPLPRGPPPAEEPGVHFQITDNGLTTKGSTGKLVLHIIGAIAEFERSFILERTELLDTSGLRLGLPSVWSTLPSTCSTSTASNAPLIERNASSQPLLSGGQLRPAQPAIETCRRSSTSRPAPCSREEAKRLRPRSAPGGAFLRTEFEPATRAGKKGRTRPTGIPGRNCARAIVSAVISRRQ